MNYIRNAFSFALAHARQTITQCFPSSPQAKMNRASPEQICHLKAKSTATFLHYQAPQGLELAVI